MSTCNNKNGQVSDGEVCHCGFANFGELCTPTGPFSICSFGAGDTSECISEPCNCFLYIQIQKSAQNLYVQNLQRTLPNTSEVLVRFLTFQQFGIFKAKNYFCCGFLNFCQHS